MAAHPESTGFAAAYSRAATGWIDAMRRFAVLVTVLSLALTTAAAVYTARNLTVSTDTANLISPDLAFRRDADELKAKFPQFHDTVSVVLDASTADGAQDAQSALTAQLRADKTHFRTVFAPDADDFFARNGLLYLDEDALADLSDRLADAQPLLARLARDPSLSGLFDVLGLAIDDLGMDKAAPRGLRDVLARIEAVALSVFSGAPRNLSWVEMMMGGKTKPSERRRFITVQPVMDYTSLQPAKAAMDAIRRHAAALGHAKTQGIRLRLTGGAAMATEELASVSRGASLAGLISLVLVTLVLAFGLRSARLVAAILMTLVMGLIWTAGFTTLAIGHLNLISVAFAVLFIGLGVDFGIHFGLRYKEEIAKGATHGDALRNAGDGVAGALGLCTLAAAASFFAFVPTDYDGLSELGIIAGVGMFIALFANLTVLPALLTLMPLKSGRAAEPGGNRFEAVIQRRAKPVTAVALVLGIAAAGLLPSARFDFNPVSLKDPTTESVATFLELMAEADTAPYTIQVLAPDLDSAKKQTSKLVALAEVDHTVTLADFIPSGQEDKLAVIEDIALFMTPIMQQGETKAAAESDRAPALASFRKRLAASRHVVLRPRLDSLATALSSFKGNPEKLATLEKLLLHFLPARLDGLRLALEAEKFGRADLREGLRARFLSADGIARIQVFPAENINDNRALRRFVAAVRQIAPRATDSPVEIIESGDVVVSAIRNAAFIALAAIFVLLITVLRSLRDTMLVIAPLALAALLTVAASVALGISFNFANVIVLPLLAGLGVASGIHLVARAREPEQTTALMQTSTPRAVILSALTTIGSFGSLAVSSHRGTSSMGELLTIAIAFTLISTLIVLPALMSWTNRNPR